MAILLTPRRGNRYPDPARVDAPDIPAHLEALAFDLEDAPRDDQGTIGGRPTQTALSPGEFGEWYVSDNETDDGATRRRVYRSHGTGYDELATLPISRRMLAAFPHFVFAGSSGSQSIPDDTPTSVTFTTETSESPNGWTGDGTTFTVPHAGLLLAFAYAVWAPNATGYRVLRIMHASASTPTVFGTLRGHHKDGVSGTFTGDSVPAIAPVSAGDKLRVQAEQTSGGSLALDDQRRFAGVLLPL